MEKYELILTRNISESCTVTVEAETEEAAIEKGESGAYLDECASDWETDQMSDPGGEHVSSCERVDA